MTAVSSDPSWWPTINSNMVYSYFVVACSAGVVYDWALTFGQEVELIWGQRWSLMTVLSLSVRYIGILHAGINMLNSLPSLSVTGVGCNDIFYILILMEMVASLMVGVIVIARLYAMHQRSRKILSFLVVIFLAVNIPCGVMTGVYMTHYVSGDELVIDGTYLCSYVGDIRSFTAVGWALNTAWEVLALYLAVRIAVKHFCELRQFGPLTGQTTRNCFTVLIQTHVLYFASFAAASCFNLCVLSPNISNLSVVESQIYRGIVEIVTVVYLFVLGPRLILSVREYHAQLVSDSDAGTGLTTIAFQECIHVSTDSTSV